MEKHEPFVSRKGFKKHRILEKMLQPGVIDQNEKGEEMGCTVEEIEHSWEISGPVGGISTQECENMVDQEEDQAFNFDLKKTHTAVFNSPACLEEEVEIGSTYQYSSEINTSCKFEENIDPQFGTSAESDDICSFIFIGQDTMHVKDVLNTFFIVSNFFLHNKMSFDAVNLSALEKKPTVSKNSIVVKHPNLAIIINGEYIRWVLQERYIFQDCRINAALMGTKSCVFCTDCYVPYKIPISFILALCRSQCMLRRSCLNTLLTLSLCRLFQELLAIDANIDQGEQMLYLCNVHPELPEIPASKGFDDKVCCVFCAVEVPVKNARDFKKGQHLTRPGQSHCSWWFLGLCISLWFPLYRHHLFLKDIVVYSDQTAMLTLIHMTKFCRRIEIYETVESCYVPDANFKFVDYNSPKFPLEAINDHAESSVNFRRKPKLDSYNLLFHNCETVIREFMVGSKISLQVWNSLEKIANISIFLLCIASLFMTEYIRMFTFVAYCIFFLHLAMNLSTCYKKDKIICGSCFNDIRIKIFCQVTFWTLIFYHFYSSYALDIGWITCVFISSLN